MSRNLRDKIRLVLQDSYDIRKESIVTQIEKLVESEVALVAEERTFDYIDMNWIQSNATKEYNGMSMSERILGRIAGDAPMVRTLCIINATISFLHERGLLKAQMKYEKK